MATEAIHPLFLQTVIFILGLCVGSFLNVLALRTLAGRSIVWPPSHCPSCMTRLSVIDNLPVLSYLLLKGRCRYCFAPISLQYPAVELSTALAFLVLYRVFGLTAYSLGMAVFVCTLIAVTVTDFREKLIPHDITYPSMLAGIAFSAFVRQDLSGAMAGVGASYIIFDFLAHYGLKIYTAFYGKPEDSQEKEECDEAVDAAFALGDEERQKPHEEFEVMGGGDAVLSAVISAWLGWQRLTVALIVGFVVGTLMGMIYLMVEMRKAGLVKASVRPAAAGALFGFVFMAVPLLLLCAAAGLNIDQVPWALMGALGALAGALVGIVSVGTKVSRPFPFGPALAVGGVVAIFWDPFGWLWTGGA